MQSNGILLRVGSLVWDKRLPSISGFELQIPVGSICALMGSSGIGKSTILKAAVGWGGALKGDAEVIDSGGRRLPFDELVLMPQDSEDLILPWYTVDKNLQLAAHIGGVRVGDHEIAEGLKAIGLDRDVAEQHPMRLSGGQQRRLALGMVLLRGGTLLLLDEPCTGLDPDLRLKIWDLLYACVKNPAPPFVTRAGAIFMISHAIEEVAALCERVIFICPGGTAAPLILDRPSQLSLRPSQLFRDECLQRSFADWELEVRRAFSNVCIK